MTLTRGTKIGSYEIAAQIGIGGMGEVYRATDTKLARQVAIKVLPGNMAADAERLARFDREAKTLAALNHPNIAAIYGLEDAGGSSAIVMELVEGQTLADRIAGDRITVGEALSIGTQIAEALEAAHTQGIVHRDLKPANVIISRDRRVKVLDFGLAKVSRSGQDDDALTLSETQPSVILGTPACSTRSMPASSIAQVRRRTNKAKRSRERCSRRVSERNHELRTSDLTRLRPTVDGDGRRQHLTRISSSVRRNLRAARQRIR